MQPSDYRDATISAVLRAWNVYNDDASGMDASCLFSCSTVCCCCMTACASGLSLLTIPPTPSEAILHLEHDVQKVEGFTLPLSSSNPASPLIVATLQQRPSSVNLASHVDREGLPICHWSVARTCSRDLMKTGRRMIRSGCDSSSGWAIGGGPSVSKARRV